MNVCRSKWDIFVNEEQDKMLLRFSFKMNIFLKEQKKSIINLKYCPVPKHEARCHCLFQCVFMFYKQYKALSKLHSMYVYNYDVRRLW